MVVLSSNRVGIVDVDNQLKFLDGWEVYDYSGLRSTWGAKLLGRWLSPPHSRLPVLGAMNPPQRTYHQKSSKQMPCHVPHQQPARRVRRARDVSAEHRGLPLLRRRDPRALDRPAVHTVPPRLVRRCLHRGLPHWPGGVPGTVHEPGGPGPPVVPYLPLWVGGVHEPSPSGELSTKCRLRFLVMEGRLNLTIQGAGQK